MTILSRTVWNPTVLSGQKGLHRQQSTTLIRWFNLSKLGGSINFRNTFPGFWLILCSKCKWHCSSVLLVLAGGANHEAFIGTQLAPWRRGPENQIDSANTPPSSFVFVLTLITTKATPPPQNKVIHIEITHNRVLFAAFEFWLLCGRQRNVHYSDPLKWKREQVKSFLNYFTYTECQEWTYLLILDHGKMCLFTIKKKSY